MSNEWIEVSAKRLAMLEAAMDVASWVSACDAMDANHLLAGCVKDKLAKYRELRDAYVKGTESLPPLTINTEDNHATNYHHAK